MVQCGHHLRWMSKKAFTRIFGVTAAVNRDVMSQTYWLSKPCCDLSSTRMKAFGSTGKYRPAM